MPLRHLETFPDASRQRQKGKVAGPKMMGLCPEAPKPLPLDIPIVVEYFLIIYWEDEMLAGWGVKDWGEGFILR